MLDFARQRVGALRHDAQQVADEPGVERARRRAHGGHAPDVQEQHGRVFGCHHVDVEGQVGLAGIHFGERLARSERCEDAAVAPVVLLLQPYRAFQHDTHRRGAVAHAEEVGAFGERALPRAQALQHGREVGGVDVREQGRSADEGQVVFHRAPLL